MRPQQEQQPPKPPKKPKPPEPPRPPDTSRVVFGFGTGGGRRNIRKPLGD